MYVTKQRRNREGKTLHSKQPELPVKATIICMVVIFKTLSYLGKVGDGGQDNRQDLH